MTLQYFVKLILILAFGLTTACVATQQVSYDTPDEELSTFDRTVQYELNDRFFSVAPACVTVLTLTTENRSKDNSSLIVEEAIARHLNDHITRVIKPFERDALTRQMAVDLSHPTDRQAYSRNIHCNYFLELSPLHHEDAYLVFWSQSTLGVEARLTDVSGKITLWKARHVAKRSDGGLPFSPLSAAYSAFNAGVLSGDQDVPYSLADDLARRLTATLPDIRRIGQIAIQN